jgi:hypothetical protein
MHTLIPFAAAPGPQCHQALDRLALPHLEKLLQRLVPEPALEGKSDALTPLHERFAAKAAGLAGPDGLIPWAAHEAQARGLTALHGADGWAWITPCHWTVHADHVAMADPAHMSLTTEDIDTLWRAMEPYFAEDGITLFAHAPEHPARSTTRSWLAHGAVFRDLPTASLDRVAGQKVDSWMPRQPQAKTLRRLQNEMQMLLYTHPLNDERAKYKLASINSFWVSGTGVLDTAPSPAQALTMDTSLRTSALADDAAQWAFAWHALDSSVLKQALELVEQNQPIEITLCGERRAVTLQHREAGLWRRLTRRLADPQALALLKTL